jgi:hypothetical protein
MRCEARHLCSWARVFFFFPFFLDARTLNFTFCVTMITGTEHQKIFFQMQDENIEIESLPSVFRSFLGPSVVLQKDEQFCTGTVLFAQPRLSMSADHR